GNTASGVSHTIGVSLVITGDYSLAATPASHTVTAGASTSYTLNLTTIGGFSSAVGFSVSGPPAGATAPAAPGSVSGAGSSTLTVATSTTTSAGTYPLAITATSATGVTHTAAVTLVVIGDFTIAATPGSQTVAAGAGASYTVNVGAIGGFT